MSSTVEITETEYQIVWTFEVFHPHLGHEALRGVFSTLEKAEEAADRDRLNDRLSDIVAEWRVYAYDGTPEGGQRLRGSADGTGWRQTLTKQYVDLL